MHRPFSVDNGAERNCRLFQGNDTWERHGRIATPGGIPVLKRLPGMLKKKWRELYLAALRRTAAAEMIGLKKRKEKT
ncbi:hypothetical protein [Herbaspirillum sp. RV1423]|uniref:hypothetical protein n=1 Tax=Herbaspirillum sp. RV1423 TaxID=1443993 RepID=UPI0012DEA42F|nr:hypothetical protein [Herbaspirillum sp. RV1423]